MNHEYVGQTVRLRPLRDDDLDTVVRLYRSTPNYYATTGFGREPNNKLTLQRELMEMQRTDERVLYAIERRADHVLIGFADVQLESMMSDAATIVLLVIGGPYQHQGYGSDAADLLEQALFSEPDVDFIMAGVAEPSAVGVRFWQKRGYEFSGLTTHDPQTSQTTLWLAKPRTRAAATTAATAQPAPML